MKELMSLIKAQLNMNFGISAMKFKYFKQQKELWQPLIFAFAALAFMPIYMSYLNLLRGLYEGFKGMNQEGMLLLMGFLLAQMVLFIFGITYVLGKFYYSDDMKILIPLPVRPQNIIIAKFVTLLANEYLTILPLLWPVFLVFARGGGLGGLYWVHATLIYLFLPIIPLGLSSILVMLFMKITNIKGKRDSLRIIGSMIMVALILGLQLIIRSATMGVPIGQEEAHLANIIQQHNALIRQMGMSFPPSIWATLGLTQYAQVRGLGYLGLFIGVSAIVFYAMVLLGKKVFYEGLIGGEEESSKKAVLSEEKLEKYTRGFYHPIVAIALREMKLLLRTPIFFLNSIGAVIIIPFAIGMSLVMSGDALGRFQSFYTPQNRVMVDLGLIAFLLFVGSTNGVAPTTFSREGKQFWISRIVPVRAEDHLIGKLVSALLVQLLAIIMILGASSFVIRLDAITIVAVLTLGLLGSIPINQLSMLIDISRPLLDWDNPQKAMKQNLNVLFAMIGGVGYILLCGILAFAMMKISVSAVFIYLFFAFAFSVLSIVLFMVLSRVMERRFKEIE